MLHFVTYFSPVLSILLAVFTLGGEGLTLFSQDIGEKAKASVAPMTRTGITEQTVSRISGADNIGYNLSAVKTDTNRHEAPFRIFWVDIDGVGRFDSPNCKLSDSPHMVMGLILDH